MTARLSTAMLLGLLIVAPARSDAATFTFDTSPLGAPTPFSLTDLGITATFSSPDGAVFRVSPTFFSSLTGRILLDADAPLHALDIVFSVPINFVSLNFALNGPATSTFTLAAFLGGVGGTPRGGATTVGTIPGGFSFPEGFLSFSSTLAFDTIRLTSSAQDFAIDNVSTVPEPGAIALLALGLLGARGRLRARP